jgi:hypothetical protein
MRHTQPLTADEERIDSALRKQHRTHAQQDEALTRYRLAVVLNRDHAFNVERVADLMLGERAL